MESVFFHHYEGSSRLNSRRLRHPAISGTMIAQIVQKGFHSSKDRVVVLPSWGGR